MAEPRQAYWNAHVTSYGADNKHKYVTYGLYAVDINAAWRKSLRMALDECEEQKSSLLSIDMQSVEQV